jgi:hypothetical protein
MDAGSLNQLGTIRCELLAAILGWNSGVFSKAYPNVKLIYGHLVPSVMTFSGVNRILLI